MRRTRCNKKEKEDMQYREEEKDVRMRIDERHKTIIYAT